MVIVTEASDLPLVASPAIQQLAAIRFQQLNSPNDLDSGPVEFIVVEAGDEITAIEEAAGFPILTSLFDELPFDHPDYTPPFEIIEEHHYDQCRFYELFIVTADSGAGTAIFVPDEEDVHADLLVMCKAWATPAVSTS